MDRFCRMRHQLPGARPVPSVSPRPKRSFGAALLSPNVISMEPGGHFRVLCNGERSETSDKEVQLESMSGEEAYERVSANPLACHALPAESGHDTAPGLDAVSKVDGIAGKCGCTGLLAMAFAPELRQSANRTAEQHARPGGENPEDHRRRIAGVLGQAVFSLVFWP